MIKKLLLIATLLTSSPGNCDVWIMAACKDPFPRLYYAVGVSYDLTLNSTTGELITQGQPRIWSVGVPNWEHSQHYVSILQNADKDSRFLIKETPGEIPEIATCVEDLKGLSRSTMTITADQPPLHPGKHKITMTMRISGSAPFKIWVFSVTPPPINSENVILYGDHLSPSEIINSWAGTLLQ